MALTIYSVFLVLLLPFAFALKFDLIAQPGHSTKNERCIRNFVAKDTLVVVTATVSGQRGDGQLVNMHVRFIRRRSSCEEGQDIMLILVIDQGCSWQRLRPAERHRWRDQNGLHQSSRHSI